MVNGFIKKYWNGRIQWFTPTEIGINKYVVKSIRKITVEGLKNSSARILPVGTVLLTSRAGIGDLSILKEGGCTNQGFQSLIAKKLINNEFLYYLMITLKNGVVSEKTCLRVNGGDYFFGLGLIGFGHVISLSCSCGMCIRICS